MLPRKDLNCDCYRTRALAIREAITLVIGVDVLPGLCLGLGKLNVVIWVGILCPLKISVHCKGTE